MNITDLIVELLQQGKQVELPGMGTFGSEMQPPYHDPASGTYFPARRTLTFSTATSGDESIVQALAQRECVGDNVARQMWKNYVDALTDKLQRTGNHTFGDLGTLSYDSAHGYGFKATDGMALTVGDEKPIEGVRTYAHDNEEDPFAKFDAVDAETEARREAERRAEEERLEAERKAEEERREAERRAEEERREAERRAEEERRVGKECRSRGSPEHEKARLEAEQKAEEERAEAERKAEEERKAEAKLLAEVAALTDAVGAAKEALAEPSQPVAEPKKKKDKKKRRFPWWLLILLLLLLLLGSAAYYYFKVYLPTQPKAEYIPSQPVGDVPVVTDLTFNTDLLQYGQQDIDRNSDQVCHYMEDYIYSYLAYRHYAGAMTPMMERVRQYVGERLGTLMADRFAIQRLYPFNDYIYSHNEPYLRQKFAAAQRVKVQGELLDMHTLDQLLDRMVTELGLEPDAAAAGAVRPAEPAQANAATLRTTDKSEETPVRVNMEQESRQGFDIIAGFYLDRATAARLTARLHELGSDAYIIEKNNMYYVSMGSAKNRTSAEALFKHIKSWYDGDIAIKQW
jgi:nucleoid DNA-binding protein